VSTDGALATNEPATDKSEQEVQYPLTGQRAANFTLLANQ